MQDIWDRILSLLPLQDAARAGCVSRALLSSWTSCPNLIFTRETLGLTGNACGKHERAQTFKDRVDHVLKKHSGIGVKTFKLHYCGSGYNDRYFNRWLQIAVTPGIEEVILSVPMVYYFLWSSESYCSGHQCHPKYYFEHQFLLHYVYNIQ